MMFDLCINVHFQILLLPIPTLQEDLEDYLLLYLEHVKLFSPQNLPPNFIN